MKTDLFQSCEFSKFAGILSAALSFRILNNSAEFSQRRHWHPTPVRLPGKSHERRSLVGCSPWGHEESDTTEQFPFHFSLSCTGEGNGNPLQCSCLENPRDGGAWWATIYEVAQSWTRLKWRSSSSSSSSSNNNSNILCKDCFCLFLKEFHLYLKGLCRNSKC